MYINSPWVCGEASTLACCILSSLRRAHKYWFIDSWPALYIGTCIIARSSVRLSVVNGRRGDTALPCSDSGAPCSVYEARLIYLSVFDYMYVDLLSSVIISDVFANFLQWRASKPIISAQRRIYTVSGKKRTNSILGITSSNTGRFSKFFQCHNLLEICNKTGIKFPTTP